MLFPSLIIRLVWINGYEHIVVCITKSQPMMMPSQNYEVVVFKLLNPAMTSSQNYLTVSLRLIDRLLILITNSPEVLHRKNYGRDTVDILICGAHMQYWPLSENIFDGKWQFAQSFVSRNIHSGSKSAFNVNVQHSKAVCPSYKSNLIINRHQIKTMKAHWQVHLCSDSTLEIHFLPVLWKLSYGRYLQTQ